MSAIPKSRNAAEAAARIRYLTPASSGSLALAEIPNQAVERNAQDFQPEEERCKVAARHQDRRAQRRRQQQDVQLLAVNVVLFEIAVAKQRDGRCRREDQAGIEEGVAIDDEQGRHLARRDRIGDPERAVGGNQPCQGERENWQMRSPDRDRKHRNDRCAGQQQQRQERDEIRGIHQVSPTSAGKSARPAFASCASPG